jgi:hypothetical protein
MRTRALPGALIVALTLFVTDRSDAAGFCDDLKSVIVASSNLSELKGPSLSATMWQAKVDVATFPHCTINTQKSGEIFYFCQRDSSTTFETVKPEFDQIRLAIDNCLPQPPWSGLLSVSGKDINMYGFNSMSDGYSGAASIFKGFDSAITNGKVELNDTWYLTLTIYNRQNK